MFDLALPVPRVRILADAFDLAMRERGEDLRAIRTGPAFTGRAAGANPA